MKVVCETLDLDLLFLILQTVLCSARLIWMSTSLHCRFLKPICPSSCRQRSRRIVYVCQAEDNKICFLRICTISFNSFWSQPASEGNIWLCSRWRLHRVGLHPQVPKCLVPDRLLTLYFWGIFLLINLPAYTIRAVRKNQNSRSCNMKVWSNIEAKQWA